MTQLKPLKVVHVFSRKIGEEISGGERYPLELLAAQDRSELINFRTYVVTTKARVWRGLANTYEKSSLLALYREIRLADLVHVHMFRMMAFDVSCALALIARKPLVLTDHGGGQKLAPSRYLGKLRRRFVSAIAAVSPWSAFNDLSDLQPLPTKILWGGGDQILRSPNNNRAQAVDVLFVGRLLPHKGIHILIEALPDGASMRIVGRPDAGEVEYMNLLTGLAKGKQVEFAHDIPDDFLLAQYKSARVLVLPSVTKYKERRFKRPELLGLVVLESLAAGTPAVGSDFGGLSQLLANVSMPVVPPNDAASLKQELSKLLENREYEETLRGLAQSAAHEYSWDEVARRSIDLYQEILD